MGNLARTSSVEQSPSNDRGRMSIGAMAVTAENPVAVVEEAASQLSWKSLSGIGATSLMLFAMLFQQNVLQLYGESDGSGVGLRVGRLLELHVECSPKAWFRLNITEIFITALMFRMAWLTIGSATRMIERPRLEARAQSAVESMDMSALEAVFEDADALKVDLPKPKTEYLDSLQERLTAFEFREQVAERKRLNVSLNVWEPCAGDR